MLGVRYSEEEDQILLKNQLMDAEQLRMLLPSRTRASLLHRLRRLLTRHPELKVEPVKSNYDRKYTKEEDTIITNAIKNSVGMVELRKLLPDKPFESIQMRLGELGKILAKQERDAREKEKILLFVQELKASANLKEASPKGKIIKMNIGPIFLFLVGRYTEEEDVILLKAIKRQVLYPKILLQFLPGRKISSIYARLSKLRNSQDSANAIPDGEFSAKIRVGYNICLGVLSSKKDQSVLATKPMDDQHRKTVAAAVGLKPVAKLEKEAAGELLRDSSNTGKINKKTNPIFFYF